MTQNPQTVKFNLGKETELRIEVGEQSRKVSLELKEGFAEVFGTELLPHKRYEFGCGSKVAVFSWQGCLLELSYRPSVCYVARETPMPFYLNIHAGLENLRRTAEVQRERGPVVLVAGPPDVGKSSLCRLLLNYAVKSGRRPLYADLDPQLGQVSIPGTICAMPIGRSASVTDGFDRKVPLVLHYGHLSPDSNVSHFNALVATLAEHTLSRVQRKERHRAAGIVIDTCGACSKDAGYETLLHAVRVFGANLVFVIDHEKLLNQLTTDLPKFVKVIAVPKNGGAMERSVGLRTKTHEETIRDYFYGRMEREHLRPHIHEIKFSELKLYRLTSREVPSSCLPAGMTAPADLSRRMSPVRPTTDLLYHLLVLSHAQVADKLAPLANVMGFVCVKNVDLELKVITVLSPQPGPLPPNHILFVSEVQFFD